MQRTLPPPYFSIVPTSAATSWPWLSSMVIWREASESQRCRRQRDHARDPARPAPACCRRTQCSCSKLRSTISRPFARAARARGTLGCAGHERSRAQRREARADRQQHIGVIDRAVRAIRGVERDDFVVETPSELGERLRVSARQIDRRMRHAARDRARGCRCLRGNTAAASRAVRSTMRSSR